MLYVWAIHNVRQSPDRGTIRLGMIQQVIDGDETMSTP